MNKRRQMVGLFLALVMVLLVACTPQAAPVPAAPAKPAWQTEWDNTLAVAKTEGQVVIWTGVPQWRAPFAEALNRQYGIKGEVVIIGRTAEIQAKLFTERRAGLYTVDILIQGPATAISVFKPAAVFDPLDPLLVLPEVIDPKLWSGGKLPFVDRDHTVFAFVRNAITMVAVNTNLVKQGEIASYNDLLNPKWKGKIVINDPTTGGVGSYLGIIAEPLMGGWDKGGGDFFRKLVQNEPLVMRDQRLQIDWLAHGKVAIALMPPTVPLAEFMKTGAPIGVVVPKEGAATSAGWGCVMRISNPPNPNASKVFINWLLSKEGGTIASRAYDNPSGRVDVPTDFISPISIPDPKVKYFASATEEYAFRNAEDMKRQKEIFGHLVRK